MKKIVVVVSLLIALLAFTQLTFANARGAEVPFKVTCATYPEAVGMDGEFLILSIPGDCVGTHLGRSEWYSDLMADVVPPFPAPQYGTMVFTAANGAQLYGEYVGENVPSPTGGGFEYWGEYELTDGTGRFSGVTGSGIYYGGPGDGAGTLTFEGTLVKP